MDGADCRDLRVAALHGVQAPTVPTAANGNMDRWWGSDNGRQWLEWALRAPDRWRLMAWSLTIVLPFFPTGTMERVEIEGAVSS